MRRLLAFTLHATAAAIMGWGWYTLTMSVDSVEWMHRLKGGYFVFLTNQGLAITWLCMVVSLLCDVFPSVAIVRDTKRALLMISMPLEFVISTIYWSLLLSFPYLIIPQGSRGGARVEPIRLPLAPDLALHASPLLALLIDFFVFQPKFPKTCVHKVAPTAILAFAVWYASFVEYCATFNQSFPYPFLTHSPFPGRVLIYTATVGIALGCFRILNALHS